MKLRKIKLTPSQLTELMQGKGVPLALPADAELLDSKVDLFSQTVWLIVRSGTFEDIPDGSEIPEINALSTSPTKPAVSPVPIATSVSVAPKAEPKVEAATESRPFVPRPTQPPLSRYASKMENEFSPDQRKLLSFTVKDDAVIVKPVTFLKAEWEDINDVVRSLGGRWVKGDIISYWEIPLQ